MTFFQIYLRSTKYLGGSNPRSLDPPELQRETEHVHTEFLQEASCVKPVTQIYLTETTKFSEISKSILDTTAENVYNDQGI